MASISCWAPRGGGANFHAGSCGEWFLEKFAVNLVYPGEVLDMGDKDGCLGHIFKIRFFAARMAADSTGLRGLGFYAAFDNFAGLRIYRHLAGDKTVRPLSSTAWL